LLDFLCELYYGARIHEHQVNDIYFVMQFQYSENKTGSVYMKQYLYNTHSCQGNKTIFTIRIVGAPQGGINNIKTPVCCHGDARMGSLCTVVEQRGISYCCQQYKGIWVIMSSTWYCCPILAEFEVSRQIFRKRSQISNFTQNPTSRGRTDTGVWADTTNL